MSGEPATLLQRFGWSKQGSTTAGSASVFSRIVLPGLAFKAVVIGGGYATGRELAEFFGPSGLLGGLLAMAVAMAVWMMVCVLTFLYAYQTKSFDYHTFFANLLGRFSFIFEAAYIALLILLLSVFSAAAGSIGSALFSWPSAIGALCFMLVIGMATFHGNRAVENLFKYVSIILYATYAIFLYLSIWRFGPLIAKAFAKPAALGPGWGLAGLTFACYNIVGAVTILPTTRHFKSAKDAILAGLLCGPVAIAPAFLFFICMSAFFPGIDGQTLPSNFLLAQIGIPAFQFIFELMIFAALVESGTGVVNALNERVARAYRVKRNKEMPSGWRAIGAALVMVMSAIVAARFGLVALIANGYRILSLVFIGVYVAPLMTIGLWCIVRQVKGAGQGALL